MTDRGRHVVGGTRGSGFGGEEAAGVCLFVLFVFFPLSPLMNRV